MTAGKTQREVQHKHLIVYPRNICLISCRTIVFVHLISFFASRRQTTSEEVHFSFCFLYSASVSSKRKSYCIKNTVEPNVFFPPLLRMFKKIFLRESHSESQNDRSRKTNTPIIPIPLSTVHPVGSKASQTFSNKGQFIFQSLHMKRGRSSCCFFFFINSDSLRNTLITRAASRLKFLIAINRTNVLS